MDYQVDSSDRLLTDPIKFEPQLADSAGIKHPDTIAEMVANRSKAALQLNR